MAGKINLYNLGSLGVDLTKSPLHKDDGSLVQAQNAVPDVRGESGGLTKRDGLVALNSSGVGSITGAIAAAVGSGTFAAGASGNRVYITRVSNWQYSVDGFVTRTHPTTIVSNGVSEAKFANIIDVNDMTTPSQPWAAVFNNQLYFAADFTQGTNPPPIHTFDGTTSKEFTTVPINPTFGVVSNGITCIIINEGTLYVSTWDTGTSSADVQGSVYSLSPTTGQFTKLGATFPVGYLPWCLAWHAGRLWAGTHSDNEAFAGRVYWIRPGIDTAWTLDHTTTVGQGEITSLLEYNGELYAATHGDATHAALVKKRTTLGVWSASLTDAAASSMKAFNSLEVFQGNLYVALFDKINATTQATIQKFNGTSWSVVHTFSVTQDESSYRLFAVGNEFLLAFQLMDNNNVLYSTNGTSFTASALAGTIYSSIVGVLTV